MSNRVNRPDAKASAPTVSAVAWAPLAVHTSALLRQERAALHLTATRGLGAGRRHLLRHELLPAVLPPVTRHAVLAGCVLRIVGFVWLGYSRETWAVVGAVLLVAPVARAWVPDLAEDGRLGLYTGALSSVSGVIVLVGWSRSSPRPL